jgi:hypothetical protein
MTSRISPCKRQAPGLPLIDRVATTAAVRAATLRASTSSHRPFATHGDAVFGAMPEVDGLASRQKGGAR